MSSTLLEARVAPASRRGPGSRAQVVAAATLLALVGLAVVGPPLLGDPTAQDLGRYLEAPSPAEPLGRDDYGRSVLTRLAHATRLSLALAAGCVATALLLGVGAGVAAAWSGGWVDGALRAVSETLVAIPGLLVVLLVSSLAAGGSLWPLYLGLALVQWVEYFRVVRARSGLVLGSPAVQAAGLLGLGRRHVLRQHLWPELRPLLLTLASLGMVTSILAMATLGFVRVGVQPPRAELGLMITESFPFYDVAPWLPLAPIVVLFLLTASLLGLRRAEGTR